MGVFGGGDQCRIVNVNWIYILTESESEMCCVFLWIWKWYISLFGSMADVSRLLAGWCHWPRYNASQRRKQMYLDLFFLLKPLQNKKSQKNLGYPRKSSPFIRKKTSFFSGTPNCFGPSYLKAALIHWRITFNSIDAAFKSAFLDIPWNHEPTVESEGRLYKTFHVAWKDLAPHLKL